jgi:hypothetical protein
MPTTTRILVLVTVALSSASFAQPTKLPSSLLGEYQSSTKRICFLSSNGDWRDCGIATDSLRLSSGQNAISKQIAVEADFVFTNGHICTFEGYGSWNGVDRVRVYNDDTKCEWLLIHSPPKIHTVVLTPSECHEHCGARGSLDGQVLRKKKSK